MHQGACLHSQNSADFSLMSLLAGALAQRTMQLPFLPGDTIGIIALILSMPYRLPLQDDLQRWVSAGLMRWMRLISD